MSQLDVFDLAGRLSKLKWISFCFKKHSGETSLTWLEGWMAEMYNLLFIKKCLKKTYLMSLEV